jgi:hypothetical protein
MNSIGCLNGDGATILKVTASSSVSNAESVEDAYILVDSTLQKNSQTMTFGQNDFIIPPEKIVFCCAPRVFQ